MHELSLHHCADVHFQRSVHHIAVDPRLRLQFQIIVGGHGAADGALITTCDTWTSPSILACSLRTSVAGWLSTVATLPCTAPSIRRPPEKVTSPSTVVPAPIKLSIRFCGGDFLRSNMGPPTKDSSSASLSASLGRARRRGPAGFSAELRWARGTFPQPADNT